MNAASRAGMVRAARRRRLWMLAIAAPFVLLLGLLGTRLVLLPVTTDRAASAYDDGRFAEAAKIYGSQDWLNVIDPWKVPYNHGTAQLREATSASVEASIDTLERAYAMTHSENAGTQCLVQTNLALAYETAGDQHAADADATDADRAALLGALADQKRGASFDKALVDAYADLFGAAPTETALDSYVVGARQQSTGEYESAIDVRDRPGCPDSTPEDQKANAEGSARVQEKLSPKGGNPPSGQPSSPSESSDPSQGPSPDPDEADRQARLGELNDQARRDADEQRQLIEDTYGNDGHGSADKRW